MKRRVIGLAIVVAILAPLLAARTPVHAADTQNFTIDTFSADYYLDRDANNASQMKVEEKIVADFPQYDQSHGILRAIPETYKGHSLHAKIDSVTDGTGHAWHYSTSHENDNLVLKIGDANKYVHGTQVYDISYTLHDVTTAYSDHDELYWDVNGDQWSQTFGHVAAKLHLTDKVAAALHTDQRCFVGSYGATAEQCTMATTQSGGNKVVTIGANRSLDANETLTFVTSFDPHTFAAYKRPRSEVVRMALLIGGLGVAPPLIAAVAMITKWRRSGRDPRGRGTIVAEYLPPKEVSVLESGVLLKEKANPNAITAQIIDLAVRHYLKIYEIKVEKRLRRDAATYEIELVRQPTGLRSEEVEALKIIFGDTLEVGMRSKLEKLKASLYTKASALGKTLTKQLAAKGYFRGDPRKASYPYSLLGGALVVLGFVGLPFTLGFAVAGCIIIAFGQAMPARTSKGVQLREYLLGLKMYMQVAEAERLKILQSPHGQLTEKVDVGDKAQLVKLYERLLPYAMLFGIEQEWMKEFAPLYEHAPDWYVGSSPAFNAAWFAASLGSFSTVSAQSFSPPSSSGGSGFGGGGFSGGGGGGGGGGGW